MIKLYSINPIFEGKSTINGHHGEKTTWWEEPSKTKHKNLSFILVTSFKLFIAYVYVYTYWNPFWTPNACNWMKLNTLWHFDLKYSSNEMTITLLSLCTAPSPKKKPNWFLCLVHYLGSPKSSRHKITAVFMGLVLVVTSYSSCGKLRQTFSWSIPFVIAHVETT